jgi:hypothetical protein
VTPETTTWGTWEEPLAQTPPHNKMTLDAHQLASHWRRCSLSSDFWARYSTLFVPATVPAGNLPRTAVEGVLSYLFNELFENCAKFSRGPLKSVQYQSWVQAERIVIQMRNHICPEDQAPFLAVIQELIEGDPDELYFQKLEESFETDSSGSGLGYLSLIKDYGIQFGFRFEPITAESVAVDVQAHLSLKEN